MPPAARVTDMHVCPMVTPGVPPIPHVGGPILPPGAPTVLIDFLPAATVTTMATCVGPPDVIVKGSTGVMINYLPAARLGDQTAHGGVIVLGSVTCIIGEVGSPSPGAGGLGGVVAGLINSFNDVKSAVASIYAIGKKAAEDVAVSASNAAKSIADSIENAAASAFDAGVKMGAEWGAQFLGGNKTVRNWLLDHCPGKKTQTPFDGKLIGAGCKPANPANADQVTGIRPPRCADPRAMIPKVYFANGMLVNFTEPDAGMCASMQKIAEQMCAEVVGVYGATEGLIPDLDLSVNEIAKNSFSKQTNTLVDLMEKALDSDPPQDLTLIAHSRGGLATQEALDLVKNDLSIDAPPEEVDELMSHLHIQAYGTAEQGWPKGPSYKKLNNDADPVPAAIKGAQSNYPDATFADNDETKTRMIHDPHFDPFEAHSMDNVYASYLRQAPGPRNCDCT